MVWLRFKSNVNRTYHILHPNIHGYVWWCFFFALNLRENRNAVLIAFGGFSLTTAWNMCVNDDLRICESVQIFMIYLSVPTNWAEFSFILAPVMSSVILSRYCFFFAKIRLTCQSKSTDQNQRRCVSFYSSIFSHWMRAQLIDADQHKRVLVSIYFH